MAAFGLRSSEALAQTDETKSDAEAVEKTF